jgi:hypothetical protein
VNGHIALGLALAIASAAAINGGYYVQHGAATRLPPLTVRRPLRSLALPFRNVPWVGGFFAGIGGWVLYVVALKLAPLSIVQAASAGGIALLALLVGRLSRRELGGVVVSVAGLILLGLSLIHTTAPSGRGAWTSVALWIAISLAVAAFAAGPRSQASSQEAQGSGSPRAFCMPPATSGRRRPSPAARGSPSCPRFWHANGLAFVALQLGFQRGSALATAGLATLWTNALPIAAGTLLFAESLPAGARGVARIAAFVCVVVGAVVLARPEPAPRAHLESAPAAPDYTLTD